jgi:MFS family permease
MLVIAYSFNSLLVPATNAIYQENVGVTNRGRIFGITASVSTFIAMGITYLIGRMLDLNESSYHFILLITGISGFLSALTLSFIHFDTNYAKPLMQPLTTREFIFTPITRMIQILRTDREFAKFERNFSFYGMGFIILQPVLPLYMVQYLKMNYTNNFLAKGILSQLGVLVLSPVIGKLHDKCHPHLFTSLSFGSLALFPMLLLASGFATSYFFSVLLVNIAFVLFGVAMTGVNIAWNMGSIFFASEGESPMYQSVHVTMTGIRGVLAPLLALLILRVVGALFSQLIGIYTVFAAALFFLLLAAFLSRRDYRNLKIQIQPATIPAVATPTTE